MQMPNVVQDVEPIYFFEDAIGNVCWEHALDEEMVALDRNEI